MKRYIRLQDVSVIINNKVIFEHFSLDILNGRDICLIGQEGCGKTTLLRAILEGISFSGEITKKSLCLGILSSTTKSIKTIYEYLNYESLSESDQLFVKKFLNLKSLHYPISKLSLSFRIKVLLLEQILKNPEFLFFDDILWCFDLSEKKIIFDFLHERKITVFYVSSNIEDTLLFPYVVVMGSNGILMEGNTLSVLQEEKILKRLGFTLPFFVDLSLHLKSYDLIENIYIDGKEMMKELWKSN